MFFESDVGRPGNLERRRSAGPAPLERVARRLDLCLETVEESSGPHEFCAQDHETAGDDQISRSREHKQSHAQREHSKTDDDSRQPLCSFERRQPHLGTVM